jgi:hypothetical protein
MYAHSLDKFPAGQAFGDFLPYSTGRRHRVDVNIVRAIADEVLPFVPTINPTVLNGDPAAKVSCSVGEVL